MKLVVPALLAIATAAFADAPMSDAERKLVAAVGAEIALRDATHATVTKSALDTLVRYGATLVARTMRLSPGQGVKMMKVHPEGICARFGFQVGDVVTSVNRVDATTAPVVQLFVDAKPGARLVVQLVRAGQPMKLEIKVTK